MRWAAIVRDLSPRFQDCELTHRHRRVIDMARAVEQHEAYVSLLESLGVDVHRLPPRADFPDSVFVEDTAVVADELAVMTRPGAPSRRGEVPLMEPALAPHRSLERIHGEAVLDGGDVLMLGKRVWVGLSGRTNVEGLNQLAAYMRPHGYRVEGVPVTGCLHLKSAVTAVSPDTVLLNRDYVDPGPFSGVRCLTVDPGEPEAANCLQVGESLVFPLQYPRTAEKLRRAGHEPRLVDNRELVKGEGALTCCSLLFRL